jgi:hypothetical protein
VITVRSSGFVLKGREGQKKKSGRKISTQEKYLQETSQRKRYLQTSSQSKKNLQRNQVLSDKGLGNLLISIENIFSHCVCMSIFGLFFNPMHQRTNAGTHRARHCDGAETTARRRR